MGKETVDVVAPIFIPRDPPPRAYHDVALPHAPSVPRQKGNPAEARWPNPRLKRWPLA
jgi:hypothetical protein